MTAESNIQDLVARMGADLKHVLPAPTAPTVFTKYELAHDGTGFLWVPKIYVAKQNNFTFSSTVYTTDPELSWTLPANQTWKFTYHLRMASQNSTADFRYQVAALLASGFSYAVNAENSISKNVNVNTGSANIPFANSTGNNGDEIQIRGEISSPQEVTVNFQMRNNSGTIAQIASSNTRLVAERIA